MRNLFVPYALALALKEKGFDEECLAYYGNNDGRPTIIYENCDLNYISSIGSLYPILCIAPTYSQVCDWFSEQLIDITTYRLFFPAFDGGDTVWIATMADFRLTTHLRGDVTFINHEFVDEPVNHWKDRYLALDKAIEIALTRL